MLDALSLEGPARRAARHLSGALAQGPPERLAISQDWIQAYDIMQRLGLLDLLQPPDVVRFTAAPSQREQEQFTRLACLTHWRARCRNTSAGALLSALHKVERFVEAFPSLELWGRMSNGADWEQAEYNERVFAWFQDFTRDSRERGGVGMLKHGTVTGYVSTLRAALSLEAEQKLIVPQTHVLQPAAAKHMRWEDGESAERGLRLGFRAHHQRAILERAQPSLDLSSPYATGCGHGIQRRACGSLCAGVVRHA